MTNIFAPLNKERKKDLDKLDRELRRREARLDRKAKVRQIKAKAKKGVLSGLLKKLNKRVNIGKLSLPTKRLRLSKSVEGNAFLRGID